MSFSILILIGFPKEGKTTGVILITLKVKELSDHSKVEKRKLLYLKSPAKAVI